MLDFDICQKNQAKYKIAQQADFQLLESSNLISRKI